MRSDPGLIERRRTITPPITPGGPTPPDAIAQYLAAEQDLGRIRSGTNCLEAALVLLATLFDIGIMPTHGSVADTHLFGRAGELLVYGLGE